MTVSNSVLDCRRTYSGSEQVRAGECLRGLSFVAGEEPRPAEPNPMNGKVALITGGARGIGLACAHALYADGWRIALADRDTDALHIAAAEIAPDTLTYAVDISDVAGVRRVSRKSRRGWVGWIVWSTMPVFSAMKPCSTPTKKPTTA